MTNRQMTNEQLEAQLTLHIQEERRATTEVLKLINLATDRRLYLERGYPSLFEWLVKRFGYSESAAFRRIEAARLLKTVPDVEEKIRSGAVSLTNLARAQSVIRKHEKITQEKVRSEDKRAIVQQLMGKSKIQTEQILLSQFPEARPNLQPETTKAISPNEIQLTITLSNETFDDLKRVRDFLSHALPNGDLSSVITRLTEDFLKRRNIKSVASF